MAATIANASQIAIASIVHGPPNVVIYDVASIKWNTFANSLVGLLPRPSSLLRCVRLLLNSFSPPSSSSSFASSSFASSLCFSSPYPYYPLCISSPLSL